MTTINSIDLDGLDQLARLLVDAFPAPLTMGMVGTLGAGKTSLTQAIARAIDVDDADVTSPTFTLLQSHRGRFVLHHLDAYRVADEDEFLELGVEELFEQDDAWTIVEWADRVQAVMPTQTLWLTIDIDSPHARSVTLKSDDAKIQQRCDQVAKSWA